MSFVAIFFGEYNSERILKINTGTVFTETECKCYSQVLKQFMYNYNYY